MTTLRFDMKGIAIRQRLEGKWVKTMVLMRPKRRASGTAAR